MDNIHSALSGGQAFALYFLVSVVLLGLFIMLYGLITPYRELAMIRQGNTAAAIALGGSIVGFVIPIAKAIAQSAGMTDMLIWAGIAFVAQVVAYLIASALLPHLRNEIAEDHVASAILVAALAIAFGILNAASMTA